MDVALQKYVFSPSANWIDDIQDDAKQPQMVNRLLSGVLHPLIHLGYAFEFDTPGMFAEGESQSLRLLSTITKRL